MNAPGAVGADGTRSVPATLDARLRSDHKSIATDMSHLLCGGFGLITGEERQLTDTKRQIFARKPYGSCCQEQAVNESRSALEGELGNLQLPLKGKSKTRRSYKHEFLRGAIDLCVEFVGMLC